MNSLNDVIDAAKQAAAAKDFIKCRLEVIFKELFDLWGNKESFEVKFYGDEGCDGIGAENINIDQFLNCNISEDDFGDFCIDYWMNQFLFVIADDNQSEFPLTNYIPTRWLDPGYDFLTEATRWKNRYEDKKRREEEAKKKNEEERRRAQQEKQAKKKQSRENYSLMMKGICSKLTPEEKQWLFKDGIVENLPEPPGKSSL